MKPNLNSPLAIGWYWSFAYVSATFALSTLDQPSLLHSAINTVTGGIGIIEWFASKGVSKQILRNTTFYAITLLPIAVLAWHYFAIDARTRRPVPKFWHSIVPVAYIVPILLIFHTRYEIKVANASFRNPVLSFLTHSHGGITFVFASTGWLLAGLAYFSVLPLIEISNRNSNERK